MTRTPSRCSRVTLDRHLLYEVAEARWLRPVSEDLRRMAHHLSATHALLGTGDGGFAPDAAHVASIIALRSAAASASHGEFIGKRGTLEVFARIESISVGARFAVLCEAARRVEVERRIVDGLSVEPSGFALGPPSVRAARREVPVAADLYTDMLWMSGHLGRVLSLLADVQADADELDRRGLASTREGVDSYLGDVVLGLRLRTPSTVLETADRAGLLVAIEPAARARPAVPAMIGVALASDGATRGGEASGKA